MRKERVNEIWGVLFLLLGFFTLASLIFFHPDDISFYTSHPHNPVENYTGVTGAYLAFGLLLVFGISAYLIPLLFLLWSGCFFLQRVPERKFFKFLGLGLALFSMATIITITVEPSAQFSRGGVIGYLAGSHLLRYFGHVGGYIVAGACFLLSLLLATDFLIYPIIKKFARNVRLLARGLMEGLSGLREMLDDSLSTWHNRSAKSEKKSPRQEPKPAVPERISTLPEIPLKVKKYEPHIAEATERLKAETLKEQGVTVPVKAQPKEERPKPVKATGDKEKAPQSQAQTEDEKRFDGVIGSSAEESRYQLPGVDFLKKPVAAANQTDNLPENSKLLERALAEFGIEVKVVEVEQGPVITRYELLPAPGVKVNSIASLSDDLALALKATSVRLIIPIPGKSAVGIEVPNSVSNIVSFREMIETRDFQSHKAILPLVLGKTTSGKPLIRDLTTMPHILIAGSTGSGKTVCVNSIIMGLLYHATPEQLKFVMVDPKMVELAIYNQIPHMLTPVVTDVRKAAKTLNWVVNEMENRYKLFATCGVRNIQAFNERQLSEEDVRQVEAADSGNVVPARLPYIVVVIDELADLMLVARDKVEVAILRLAQLARAVGIHLVLATQRPSVDVITGVIKANFPARMSFKVSSQVDSRTVMDSQGAEKLLGRGDMLFLQPGDAEPIRGQAPFVTDAEIQAVVDYLSKQGSPEFHPEIQKVQEDRISGGTEEKDELFDEAVHIVLETRQASTSNLQRRLRLGYTRAARIIDQMEAEGIIGPQQGARPRDILVGSENSETVESQ